VANNYYTSKWMIDDAFDTLVKMNGTVARVWSAGCQGSLLSIEPELGKFNERALQQLDYVLDSARRHGIRLVLPFCDNWDYYVGGVKQFSKWRGGKGFYGDPVKGDYKAYVATVVNRTNSITGVAYKDDPFILCWEPGNELSSTPEWESEIADFIKSLDSRHMVLLSHYNFGSPKGAIGKEWLAIPKVDIYQKHYYRVHNLPWDAANDAAVVASADKAFIIGEYGWDRTNFSIDQLKEALREVETLPGISGDLFWALRGRKDNLGFMEVPGAGGDWWALYYPGRTTGRSNTEADMRERVRILSDHALMLKNQP